MKKLFLFLSLLIFSACTTFEDIDKGLASYYGQHINSLISKIGYPNARNNIAGRKLYIWDSRRTVSYSMPMTSYNSGTVNTFSGGYGSYTGTTTNWVPMVKNCFCTITVEVNSSETIIASQFNGNICGCERYARAFKI